MMKPFGEAQPCWECQHGGCLSTKRLGEGLLPVWPGRAWCFLELAPCGPCWHLAIRGLWHIGVSV